MLPDRGRPVELTYGVPLDETRSRSCADWWSARAHRKPGFAVAIIHFNSNDVATFSNYQQQGPSSSSVVILDTNGNAGRVSNTNEANCL